METSYDPEKRTQTLLHRQLDFQDAIKVFAGTTLTIEDDRQDYGEVRYQTLGLLDERLVMVVWTSRGGSQHIISMRKANEREKKRYDAQLE
jgi:hypothetical protein